MIIHYKFISFSLVTILNSLFHDTLPKNVNCLFRVKDRNVMGSAYTCEVENKLNIISQSTALVKSVAGDHRIGQNNDDIRSFCIDNKNTLYFPKGLEKLFKHLSRIRIAHGRLKEISQANFQPFPWLIELTLHENDIKVLENGIFEHNLNLSYVNLADNKIVHVGENVFDHLTKMTKLLITKNNCTRITLLKDSMEIKDVKIHVKVSCNNSEFIGLENNLIELEEEYRFVKSDDFPSFTIKVKKFQQELQNSSFSDLMSLRERTNDLFEVKNRSFWLLKDKVEYSERTLNDLKELLIQQNQNSKVEMIPSWLQITVAVSSVFQMMVSLAVLIIICIKRIS